jgi:hypothetical protein
LHPGQLHTQYLPIQEKQRNERLPVGGGRHLLFDGEHGPISFDFGLLHLAWMPETDTAAGDPQHKSIGPVDVNLLRL